MVNYREHLRRQLNFIKASCGAYDSGELAEAVRIAIAARVLFHDTTRCRSVIRGHLRAQEIRLCSTCSDLTQADSHFLGFIGPEVDTGLFRPYLNDSQRDEQVDLESWWATEPIMKLLRNNETITRRQLVLAAADKDGGAHVDSETTSEYDRLESGVGIQIEVGSDTGERWVVGFRFANLAALRQIGHEIITSSELLALL